MTDLRPGVQTTPGGGTDARSANGQRTESNIWLLDGLFNKGTYGGNSVIGGGNLAGEGATLVPLDTIQDITFIEIPRRNTVGGRALLSTWALSRGRTPSTAPLTRMAALPAWRPETRSPP